MYRAKNCANCTGVFKKDARLSIKQWLAVKCCSIACRAAYDSTQKLAARPPIEDLFKSSFVVAESGCWDWTGAISSQGYGTVRWRGTTYRAHMLSLELAGRKRPSGLNACHHCDNRRCVNPSHLYWGTAAENVGDASRRGRLRTGADNHNSRLSEEAVSEIRASALTDTELGKRFGVSRTSIRHVRIGKNWRAVA